MLVSRIVLAGAWTHQHRATWAQFLVLHLFISPGCSSRWCLVDQNGCCHVNSVQCYVVTCPKGRNLELILYLCQSFRLQASGRSFTIQSCGSKVRFVPLKICLWFRQKECQKFHVSNASLPIVYLIPWKYAEISASIENCDTSRPQWIVCMKHYDHISIITETRVWHPVQQTVYPVYVHNQDDQRKISTQNIHGDDQRKIYPDRDGSDQWFAPQGLRLNARRPVLTGKAGFMSWLIGVRGRMTRYWINLTEGVSRHHSGF